MMVKIKRQHFSQVNWQIALKTLCRTKITL